MWVVPELAWSVVMKLVECLLYISWNGDVQYACIVVPVQCDATVETPSPILCDLVFFLECIDEVQFALFSHIFHPKVVDH